MVKLRLIGVKKTCDGQSSGNRIVGVVHRIRHDRTMQEVARINHSPVIDKIDAADLRERWRVAGNIAGWGATVNGEFCFKGCQIFGVLFGRNLRETSAQVAIKGRAAEWGVRQIMDHGIAARCDIIDMRDTLRERQLIRLGADN